MVTSSQVVKPASSQKLDVKWKKLSDAARRINATKLHAFVDPKKCFPSKGEWGQPRKTFPEDEMALLEASLKQWGQWTPILVRNAPGGMFEIIEGERRWRIKSKWGEPIEIISIDVPDNDELRELLPFILAIITNENRASLSHFDKMTNIQLLINKLEMPWDEVANLHSISVEETRKYYNLMHLAESVVPLFRSGQLPKSAAFRIASKWRFDPDEQKRQAKRYIEGEITTVDLNKSDRKRSRGIRRNIQHTGSVGAERFKSDKSGQPLRKSPWILAGDDPVQEAVATAVTLYETAHVLQRMLGKEAVRTAIQQNPSSMAEIKKKYASMREYLGLIDNQLKGMK